MESSSSPSSPLLSLDIDGFYILLEDQDQDQDYDQDQDQNQNQNQNQTEEEHKWHWSLYLHRGPSSGWLFHVTRPTGDWSYDHSTSDQVVYLHSVATALKIGVIEPDMHESLRDRLAQVPLEDTERFGDLSCRTWLLRALEELDNEGYISIMRGVTVEAIEQEAQDAAHESRTSDGPKETSSQYSIV